MRDCLQKERKYEHKRCSPIDAKVFLYFVFIFVYMILFCYSLYHVISGRIISAVVKSNITLRFYVRGNSILSSDSF